MQGARAPGILEENGEREAAVISREKWRFINTGKSSSAMNMAIDEAILVMHSEGKVPPTVRFYGWEPATLSIGYFQQAEKEVDLEQVKQHGLGFVRRPTGGRAVLHADELTYSVIVSEAHPRMPSTVTEAYRVISLGLLEGFRNLGLGAEMVSLVTEEEKQKYGQPGSAACFDSPSWYELVVEGKKVAGSAQTRQRGTILQHGSILLDIDVDLLFNVLKFSSERLRERLKNSFVEKAVAINQVSKTRVDLAKAEEAFFHGFAAGLDVELVPEELTKEEVELAAELVRTRYGRGEWNFKR